MNCWSCGAEILTSLGGKISFRAYCNKCQIPLHACMGCKYYKPGMRNDCMIPDTESIADKQAINFCEDFIPHGKKNIQQEKSSAKKFNDLFKDS
ncbi:MAG: hypothetical protein EBZ47_06745 [Chlamydiae bacterium]|nr:hypothetical protein [Chlamydiota bacterium]